MGAIRSALPAPAWAADPMPPRDNTMHPYVGVHFQHTGYALEDGVYAGPTASDPSIDAYYDGDKLFEDQLNGVNIHAGLRINRHVGVEAGYFYNSEGDMDIPDGKQTGPGDEGKSDATVALGNYASTMQTQGATLEIMGYYPLERDRFELTTSLGAIYTDMEATP